MPKLQADIVWRTEGPNAVRLDPRLLALLRSLQRNATLRAASDELDLSYRAAWGLLLDASALVGAPLAELERGRGARLTRLGANLLRTDERLRQAMAPLSARFEVAPERAAGGPLLRLVASHDPLLAEFCERFAIPAGLFGEVSFRGSADSLALYARGRADVAGFHVETGRGPSPLRRHLRPQRDRLVRFVEREQGLIVAPGNPKQLRSLADVARKRARFVNRQQGSGTRLLVDRLLRDACIACERVRGYGTEEYTHLAVAATVAAGRADAGFGVQGAAAPLGLDFVPVLRERYWLVIRERTLVTAVGQKLLASLSGKPLARLARGLAGYGFEHAGSVCTVEQAFA